MSRRERGRPDDQGGWADGICNRIAGSTKRCMGNSWYHALFKKECGSKRDDITAIVCIVWLP